MLAAIVYFLIILALLFWNGFFGLLQSEHVSRRLIMLLFAIKALAVPVFMEIYNRQYGGIQNLDAGKFYHDAVVLNRCALTAPIAFMQSAIAQNDDHVCLDETVNWKDGSYSKAFYNDNRILISVHSIVHFVAFNSYFTHALFCCFLSFIGIWLICQGFAPWLGARIPVAFTLLCFIPSAWFFSGALLKEGLLLFLMGATAALCRKIFSGNHGLHIWLKALPLVFLCLLFKPYVLLPWMCAVAALHLLTFTRLSARPIFYGLSIFFLLVILGEVSLVGATGKGFISFLERQRSAFEGAAKGGIFLRNDSTYLMLAYDKAQLLEVPGRKDVFRLREGISYQYLADRNNRDTLYVESNRDTISEYELAFLTPASHSNFEVNHLSRLPVKAMAQAVYFGMARPFFYDADSPMLLVASVENAALILSVICALLALVRNRPARVLVIVMIVFSLFLIIMVVLSSPNSGAVFRYRIPASVALFLAGLMVFDKKDHGDPAD